MKTIRWNNSGSSLIFVLATLVVLSVVATSLMTLTTTSTDLFFKNYRKTKLHLEGEGVIRGFTKLTQAYMENISTMTTPLSQYIEAQIPFLTPQNYQITKWSVVLDATPIIQDLPSGAFKGMQSSTVGVHYQVELLDTLSGTRGNVSLEGLIASVSFTQFANFSFKELYLFNDNLTRLNGRVHGNDLVCIGAEPAEVRTITSGGKIQHTNQCYPYFKTPKTAFASIDGSMGNLRELKPNATSGCENCDGTGLDWANYALSRWNGNVLDSAHGVPKLQLKYSGTPKIQNRQTDWDGALHIDVQNNERLLVDPPLPSDTDSIRDLKFATKADIRIINGVWYIKDPSYDKNWPGIPVWSDHPGRFAAFAEEDVVPYKGFIHGGAMGVGQADIRAWLNIYGSRNAWPVGKTPKKFSYYEWDPAIQSIDATNGGVISYGSLAKKALNQWVPGYFAKNDVTGNSKLCGNAPARCTNCTTPDQIKAYDFNLSCSNGFTVSAATQILNSTRSGFRFNLWEYYSMPMARQQANSKILPLNFDLAAFQEALKCSFDPSNPTALGVDHPGEIGCYFKTWGLMGRPFNGVVYITNTWKGSMNKVMAATPGNHNDLDHDQVGNNTDVDQVKESHSSQHSALPFELCSDDVVGFRSDPKGLFKVPSCARYNETTPAAHPLRARPSWVRIINAKNIDTGVLPKGISIVSNLQVFVSGDVNTGSNTAPGATPWSPVLIGGDQVIPLSNNWLDHHARWDVSAKANGLVKLASDTTWNMALMSGQGSSLMYNENWAGKKLVFRGPVIQPYNALNVYTKKTFSNAPGTFQYPIRDWAYDSHYELINNQPPGIPLLTLFAVLSWL